MPNLAEVGDTGIVAVSVPGGDVLIETNPEVLTPSNYARAFADILAARDLCGARVLDVGCGSGILSIVAARQGAEVWATDISPAAIRMTKTNSALNKTPLAQVFAGSALDNFLPGEKFAHVKFDLVVCNHPSLPGKDATDLARTSIVEWNQNGNGRYLLDQILAKSTNILTKRGSLITHSSSEQRLSVTLQMLGTHWPDWRFLSLLELPVEGSYYADARENWIAEQRIYRKRGRWFHTVLLLEAFSSTRPGDQTFDKLVTEPPQYAGYK